MSEEERLSKMLEEAVKIIMNEFGYTRNQVFEWLIRKVEGTDCD